MAQTRASQPQFLLSFYKHTSVQNFVSSTLCSDLFLLKTSGNSPLFFEIWPPLGTEKRKVVRRIPGFHLAFIHTLSMRASRFPHALIVIVCEPLTRSKSEEGLHIEEEADQTAWSSSALSLSLSFFLLGTLQPFGGKGGGFRECICNIFSRRPYLAISGLLPSFISISGATYSLVRLRAARAGQMMRAVVVMLPQRVVVRVGGGMQS